MTDTGTSAHKAVKDFLAEAEEISDQLGTQLADLVDGAERGEMSPDLLNSIFRAAHSLKGLAGMFGFQEIAELSHNMENLLDWLRLGKLNLGTAEMTVLFESHEVLNALIRSVSIDNPSAHSADSAACIARINACLSPSKQTVAISPLCQLDLPERQLSSLTEYEEHRLLDNFSKGKKIYCIHTSFDLNTFDVDLSQVSEKLKSCGEIISTLPSTDGNMETNIDFDLLYGSGTELADLKQLVENDAVQVRLVGRKQPEQAPTAPEPVLQPELPAQLPQEPKGASSAPPPVQFNFSNDDSASAKSLSRTVRVDIGKLDDLMNIVGELVLAHSSIASLAVRLRNEGFSRVAIDLGKSAKGLERKLIDLQKGVMEIRMIPVGQLYEKMSRIVRKISREQGKKIDLKFFGADTELDKLIVEDISDPMMHIVRNAIDHGIEAPEKRLALGKDEKGTIRIAAFSKGNHVVIEVSDDGSGIDIDRIKNKALSRGIIQDLNAVSDKEALDFIFLPGFSTTESISEVSGRGVGMDVVRNNIASISGMVDIETGKGTGTTFIITLPITLAIIKVLIISCAGRTYALPITSVLESLLLHEQDLMTVERKEVIQLRESTLPLLRLDAFFGFTRQGPPPSEFYVVVVGVAEKRLGIVVDDLLGQQDIVIKSLGTGFKHLRGISGAADLGDQRTILVLDVASMMAEAMKTGT